MDWVELSGGWTGGSGEDDLSAADEDMGAEAETVRERETRGEWSGLGRHCCRRPEVRIARAAGRNMVRFLI